MGKHVHEHVDLTIDAEQITSGNDATGEEKLQALLDALADEDVEIEVETHSEVIEE